MTAEHQASRTLVKSPPELWAECSDAESLVRHLGEFGEIRITRLVPETSVAWEGEQASGTVEIEPSGWGTRVTLKVLTNADEVVPSEAERVAPLIAENHPVEESRSVEESRPVEEAADAKVEETSAEPDPAMATNSAPARRWKRLIARTRTWLRSGSARTEVEEEPTVALEVALVPEPVRSPATYVARPSASESADPPATLSADPPATDAGNPPRVEPDAAPLLAEPATPSIDPEAALSAALDSLGRAHHRPYSRA